MEDSRRERCKYCRHYKLINGEYACDYPMSIEHDCLEFDNHCYERDYGVSNDKSVLPTTE